MRKIYTITLLIAVLAVSAIQTQAQEVRHYWLNNQSLYNPGMTGANEDVVGSVIANQEQVLNFPGAPRTLLAQFNGRLGYSNSSLGGGISFEEYGVLKDYTAFMSYSYAVTLKKERRLIFGVGASASMIQENGSSLTTTFAGDDIYKLNTTGYNINVSLGAAYVTKRFYIGFSVPKIVHNAYDYTDNRNSYSLEPFNFNIMAGYDLMVGKHFHFMPSFMIRSDATERFNADLNVNFKYKDVFWFGPFYRVNASYGFLLGVGITKYLKISYAADMQQTAFRNGSYGNHEIMLGFKIPRFTKRIAQSPRYF